MLDLDEIKVIRQYDRSGMLGLIESFPGQCRAASVIGLKFKLPRSFRRGYRNIVSTGLGGSAIGADIIRSYIADEAKIPVFVNRNYTLPGFVGNDTLVIASSYSGNTEETISAYRDARSKKAKVIVITSGGELRRMACRDGIPAIIIPKGLPPRCALGYSSFPLLILLSKAAVIKDQSYSMGEAVEILEYLCDEKLGGAVPRKNNIAKTISGKLYLKFPVIYGSQYHMDSVVTRWRGELSENSKTLSSGHVFPELDHNEIVGWDNPKRILKGFTVIMLRDPGDHPRNSRRMDITKDILEKAGVGVIEVHSFGKELLARIFSLVYIGDFVSFYLAILNKLDPTPVDRIDYLKKELSRS